MSRIYRSLPPPGTRLGIAFSGGLDTRCAVAWLSRNGMSVYAYTADLAQPDEKDPAAIPPIAEKHGAAKARLVDCREALAREGVIAVQCGAFHLSTGGKKYFEFHQKMFASRGQIDKARALAVVREIGLDAARAERDMNSDEVRATLEEGFKLAEALGINGTPTYVLTGQVVVGAVGVEKLREAINTARCGKATC